MEKEMKNKLAMLDIWEEEEQMMERLGRRSKKTSGGEVRMDERDMEKKKRGRGVDKGNMMKEE